MQFGSNTPVKAADDDEVEIAEAGRGIAADLIKREFDAMWHRLP